jgi:hypothetical protein
MIWDHLLIKADNVLLAPTQTTNAPPELDRDSNTRYQCSSSSRSEQRRRSDQQLVILKSEAIL